MSCNKNQLIVQAIPIKIISLDKPKYISQDYHVQERTQKLTNIKNFLTLKALSRSKKDKCLQIYRQNDALRKKQYSKILDNSSEVTIPTIPHSSELGQRPKKMVQLCQALSTKSQKFTIKQSADLRNYFPKRKVKKNKDSTWINYYSRAIKTETEAKVIPKQIPKHDTHKTLRQKPISPHYQLKLVHLKKRERATHRSQSLYQLLTPWGSNQNQILNNEQNLL